MAINKLDDQNKMNFKKIINYSPNFDLKKRKKNQIKFLVFHYTGMKKELDAIRRLTNIKSKVSSHYLIKRNGDIILLVPDLYIAWHAGKSYWKNFKLLNKNSIGIEICNPGHQFNYRKFSNSQIKSLIKLCKFLISKYHIQSKNILGHSDISPKRKMDPGEKFPWQLLSKNQIGIWHSFTKRTLSKCRYKNIDNKIKNKFFSNLRKIGYSFQYQKKKDKKKSLIYLIKAFQRRFRQELVNGKIDKECFIISKNLVKKLN